MGTQRGAVAERTAAVLDRDPGGPLGAARQQFLRIAERLRLEAALRDLLGSCTREYHVSIPIQMDDGSSSVFRGFRMQHNDARGPAKGGIRFSPSGDADHARALAMWMTWKCALLDLPLGGTKGLVSCDPRLLSAREQERLCRGWVRQMVNNIGPNIDVPAPDMMTTAQHMAWMLDEFEVLTGQKAPGFITGKPVDLGGTSGRVAATGYGVVSVLRDALKDMSLPLTKSTAAIQGFGNVGRHAAERYSALGGSVVAVSAWDNATHTSYTYLQRAGIDIAALVAISDAYGGIDPGRAREIGLEVLAGDAWLEQPVDILVPAALEAQITDENVGRVHSRVRLVVEGANGPTTPAADAALHDRGVQVVPDILANAGGVTCSYFEQVQGNTNYYWSRAEVVDKLDARMTEAYRAVSDSSVREEVSLRDAAYLIAVARVATACRQRGWV